MLPLNRIIPDDYEKAHDDIEEMYREMADAINGFQGTWDVTVDGSSTGTGTYTTQAGYYYRHGLLVDCWFQVVWSAHTGSGDLRIQFPFQIKLSSDIWVGEVICNSVNYPSGTQASLKGINNTYYAEMISTGDNIASAKVQLAGTGDVIGHIRYIGQELT